MPLWLISLATLAFANGLVVCGLIILWRAGLVPFGQALFFATGAYAVALIGALVSGCAMRSCCCDRRVIMRRACRFLSASCSRSTARSFSRCSALRCR